MKAKIIIIADKNGIIINTRIEPNGKGHIYLTDPNAEIKEGDWIIYNGNLIQANNPEGVKLMNTRGHKVNELSTKIICSTDKSLGLKEGKCIHCDGEGKLPNSSKRSGFENCSNPDCKDGVESIQNVPQLSSESINYLIDYYNKNGVMPDEVEVESIEFPKTFERSSGYAGFRCNSCNKWSYDKKDVDKQCSCKTIKLNPQGTVDITIPEEKKYSREEVILLLEDMNTEASQGALQSWEFNNWISKNL